MPFIFYGISLFIMSRISDVMMKAALDNYWFVAKIVCSLTVVTALARIFLNQITLGSVGNLKNILKDCLKFIVFIAFTPLVFTESIEFVDTMAEQITTKTQATNFKSFPDIKDSIKSGQGNKDSGDDTIMQFVTTNSAELYKMIVNWISVTIAQFLNYLRNLIIIVLFASAPIFIYLGIMVGLRFYSNIVLSLAASLLIWPILSALLTKFSVTVFEADSANLTASLSQGSSLLIFALAQLFIPIFALKSGMQATSQIQGAITDAASSAFGSAKSTGAAVTGAVGKHMAARAAKNEERQSAFRL